ncbi:MAG TPA: bifunctional DNA primase/polymerase [Gemmataceae bacterium]|nr:bifunctional DNA primase/polymerase [Gemmataceae bacterium]
MSQQQLHRPGPETAYPAFGASTAGAEAPPPNGDGNGKPHAPPSVLQHARDYLAAGISVIPVRLDGSKRPLGEWAVYQERLATDDELRQWFGREEPYGIGTVCGRVSGHLELIDIDRGSLFPAWCQLVEAQAPGLVGRLCRVDTPRDPAGYHLRYRCLDVEVPGNTKLAQEPGPPDPKTGKPTRVTLIETRGEGGQGLAPGGNPKAHPSGRPYAHGGGPPLTALPVLTAAEREILLAAARSFDRLTAAGAGAKTSHARDGRLRPGDDYNARGPCWEDILTPHGWEAAHRRGEVTYWRRPGKEGHGWSATTGYCKGQDGSDLLAVFSSNADPFPGPSGASPCSCHSKFGAYALLEHGGDFKAATKALASQGYGEQRRGKGGDCGHASSGEKAGDKEFALGPLLLRPGPAHQTPSRLVVPLAVFKAGSQVDSVTLSRSAAGRKEAARLLQPHFGDKPPAAEEVARVFALIIAAAEKAASEPADPDGPTLREVVRAWAPQAWQFHYRTDRGAYSQVFRREATRADFLAYVPEALLDAAAAASDAPRARRYLLDAAKDELQVVWADLLGALPLAHAAALTPDSPAALALRQAIMRVWNAPCTNRRELQDQGPPIVIGGSLATAAREALPDPCAVLEHSKGRPGWVMIHPPYLAWCRPAVDKGTGEGVIRLGMHYGLGNQLKTDFPGTVDQESFSKLGAALGLIDAQPDVPTRTSGGKDRLAVLALDLSRELLDEPSEWAEAESQ